MAAKGWDWKPKDGARGGLLYESGNWGDVLKALWVIETLGWKRSVTEIVNYFDPFAGDVVYPLGSKVLWRLREIALPQLEFLGPAFIDSGHWPSSASIAGELANGVKEVFDLNEIRRGNWRSVKGFEVREGESAWTVLAEKSPDAAAVWLLDPYDFIADWRRHLELVVEKSRDVSILVYIYNRSAFGREAFREYRAFRRALEDLLGDRPRRTGRIPADVFLPRAHHEMLFLPSGADAAHSAYAGLENRLREATLGLARAMEHLAAFDF